MPMVTKGIIHLLPWQKNNFKGAFEMKTKNGSFGVRVEVQRGRDNPF